MQIAPINISVLVVMNVIISFFQSQKHFDTEPVDRNLILTMASIFKRHGDKTPIIFNDTCIHP